LIDVADVVALLLLLSNALMTLTLVVVVISGIDNAAIIATTANIEFIVIGARRMLIEDI
jgi:hypothetical protein